MSLMMDSCQSSKLQLIAPKADLPAEKELILVVRVHHIMRALRKRLTQIILRSLSAQRTLTLLLRPEVETWRISLTSLDSRQSTTPLLRDQTTQTRLRSARDAISLTPRMSESLNLNLTLSMAKIATKLRKLISRTSFRISPRKSWVARSEIAYSPLRPGSRFACELFMIVLKTEDEFCGVRRSQTSDFKLFYKVITLLCLDATYLNRDALLLKEPRSVFTCLYCNLPK